MLEDGTDLDKLCKAIARHETNSCTAKIGSALKSNCHGIRVRSGNGKLVFESYPNERFATSHDHCKDIWRRLYKRFPDRHLAARYSGGDGKNWLANVQNFYESM